MEITTISYTEMDDMDTNIGSTERNISGIPTLPYPTFNQELYEKILFRVQLWKISHGYIMFIMCVLGILGNILVLAALLQKSVRRTTTALHLRVLAMADFCVLITAFFRYKTYKLFLNDNEEINSVYHFDPFIQVYIEPFHWISLGISSFITLSLSIERFTAIKHPLFSKRICTIPFVRVRIGVIFAFVVVMTMPIFFAYTVEKYQKDTNSYVSVVVITRMGKNTLYPCVYHTYMIPILWYIIPWILLVIFNVMLSIHVRKSTKMRVGISNFNPNKNLTFLIIILVVTYVVCNFPKCIMVFYKLVNHMMENEVCTEDTRGLLSPTSKAFDVAEVIAEILNVLNSCLNIMIYCLVGTKFRKEMKKILTCESCKVIKRRNVIYPSVNTGRDTSTETQT